MKENETDDTSKRLSELMMQIQEETKRIEEEQKRRKEENYKENIKEEKKEIKTKERKNKEKIDPIETKKEEKEVKSKENKLAINEKSNTEIIDIDKLEKIENEIKKQKTISDKKMNDINKIVFHNVSIANIVMLYFIFLILAVKFILPETFIIYLQVFSVIMIGITIIVFEKAYKKDSAEYTIHGIEALTLSITTLLSIYIFARYERKFIYIMLTICYLFAIYYVAKSIIIYVRMKKRALKRTKDIHKIVKNRRKI